MNPGFKFNLQRLAMFSIGRTIWQQPKMSDEIKKWDDFFYFWWDSPTGQWHKLIRKLLDKIRKDTSLPEHLESELCDVVKEMGIQLYDWLMHVKIANDDYYRRLCNTYWETIDRPLKIHWTLHGTIDVKKTVEESWVKNPNPRQMCATYHMAVCNGLQEDLVHNIWNSMSDKQQWMYRGLFKEDYAVNAYYEYHRDGQLDQFKKDIDENRGSFRSSIIYDNRLTFEENLFIIFVSEGYTEAAKLMWGRLDELSRENVLEDAALVAAVRWNKPVRNYTDFARKQWAELSVFLIGLLTSEQKKTLFLSRSLDVLRIFAVTWPWKQFFIQVYDEFWGYFGNEGNYGSILFDMADRLVNEDAKTGYIVKGSKNQKLFQQCWKRIPKDQTQLNSFTFMMIFEQLIKARDMISAKMVFNDPEIASNKTKMLSYTTPLFEEMIEKNEMKLLEKFMEENFKSEREKKAFKLSLSPHEKFILKSRFDLAEKCLDWQCKNEREKNAIKLEIDYYEIGKDASLWVRRMVASRFLNWQSSILHKQRNGSNLNCAFNDKDTIYKLWNRWKLNVPNGKKMGVEFFDWFLALELEIDSMSYQRNITDRLIVLLVEAILNQRYFNIVDNLKHWCSMTEQEVKLVRAKILAASKVPICRHYIEEGEIQISRGFLQWFQNEAEKKSFINEFLAKKGSTSCYIFIANECSIMSKKKSKFRDFINTWIIPLEHAQLNQFKKGVKFQAKKSKYKQPENYKNYDIFQGLLNEMT